MKLKNEIEFLTNGIEENKKLILAYASKLKENGGYKDFNTRLANDVAREIYKKEYKNGLCHLYDTYGCSDSHITTLAIKCLKLTDII